jgi:signal transduction histidine kinase
MHGVVRSFAAALIFSACAVLLGCGGLALAASTTISSQVCPNFGFAGTTLTTTEVTPTINASADMSGTTQPQSTVNISVNSTVRATITADVSGNFAATVPLVLGDNSIVAVADDGFCGDISTSPTVALHRNQPPPPAPVIMQPADGTLTDATSILVSGTAQAGATLDVLVGGAVKGTVTVGADGSYGLTIPLVLGMNAIQTQATNSTGAGPLSPTVSVTRQSPPPNNPPPPPPPPPATPPTISSPTDGTVTTDVTILVKVTGPAGSTVAINVNGSQQASLTLATDGTGQASVPLNLGDNSLSVTTSSGTTAPISVHRNPAPPKAPVLTNPEDGTKVTEDTVKVTGHTDPGAVVDVFLGPNQAAQITADQSGNFSVDVTLKPGLNLVYAAVDTTSGLGPKSTIHQVEYDPPSAAATIAPSIANFIRHPIQSTQKLVTAGIHAAAQAVSSTVQAVGQATNQSLNFATNVVRATPKPVVHTFPFALLGLMGTNVVIFMLIVAGERRENKIQKQLLVRLQEVNHAKKTFIGLVSHYLRTPLAVLRGGADMLGMETGVSKGVVDRLAQLAEHLRETIQDLIAQVEERVGKPEQPRRPLLGESGFTRTAFWLRPSMYLPPIVVATLLLFFNYLVRRAGVVHISSVELATQIAGFIALSSALYTVLRWQALQRRDAQVLKQVVKSEETVGKARDELINSTTSKLHEDILNVDALDAGLPPSDSKQSIENGLARMKEILEKFEVAGTLREAHNPGLSSHVTISQVLKGLPEELTSQLEAKHLTLGQPDGDFAVVTSNADLLRQVVHSLVDNAIAYSKDGGAIEIGASLQGEQVVITVTDHGVGIAPEKLKSLFQPFYKAEGAEDFTHEGMGFSLYLDKLIMSYLGGTIELASQLGVSTTAMLKLPQSR